MSKVTGRAGRALALVALGGLGGLAAADCEGPPATAPAAPPAAVTPPPLTATAARQGESLVARALVAHGFPTRETGISSFALRYEGREQDPDQGLLPGAAARWEPFAIEGHADLAQQRLSFEVSSRYPGGFAFRWRRVLTPDAIWIASELIGEIRFLPASARGQVRARAEAYLLPLLLARLADAAADARWLGTVEVEGRRYEAATFPRPASGQATLLFDAASGRLARYETLTSDPLRGDWLSTFVYDDYAAVPPPGVGAGVQLPRSIRHRRGEELLEELTLVRGELGTPPAGELFAPPPDYCRVERRDPHLETVAPGVHLLVGLGGGYYNSLLVANDAGVVAVDVPLDAPTADWAAAELERVAPGKTITHAVYTHHHLDHTGSAAGLAHRGATLVTTPGNRELMATLARAGGVTAPTIVTVDERIELGSGGGRVIVERLPPTPHVEEMLLVFLPAHGIVFDGDLFSRLVPPNETAIFFVHELDRLAWRPRTLLGSHHPALTLEELRGALASSSRQKSGTPRRNSEGVMPKARRKAAVK